jgi:hypothetical protein
MQTELHREILQYAEYKRQQRVEETEKLQHFIITNTREAWKAMTKQRQVKGFKAIRDKGVVVWSEAVVDAVYSACMLEAKRLKNTQSNDAYDSVPVSVSHLNKSVAQVSHLVDLPSLHDQRVRLRSK